MMKKIKNIYWISRAVFTAIFVFLFTRTKYNQSNNESLRVLVIPQLTRIGDIVCATPVLRAIKERYPKSFIAVLVSNKAAGILKNNPRVDELVIFEEYSFKELIHKVRKLNFDWSLNLSATSIGSVLTFLGGINGRVKTIRHNRPKSEFVTDWLNTHTFLYEDRTYLPRHHLKLLGPIGINNTKDIKEVFVSTEGERKTVEFFAKNGIKPDDFLVGISISAGNRIKEWGDHNFLKLAGSLKEKYKAKIVIIGSKNDDSRIEEFLRNLNHKAFKTTNFSLEELPSLISCLKLYIAVDTGPIYIAHALGVPLINIIGPVDPNEQPPKGEKSVQVLPYPNIPPSSFVFKKNGPAEITKLAIRSISVESVLAAARQLYTL